MRYNARDRTVRRTLRTETDSGLVFPTFASHTTSRARSRALVMDFGRAPFETRERPGAEAIRSLVSSESFIAHDAQYAPTKESPATVSTMCSDSP